LHMSARFQQTSSRQPAGSLSLRKKPLSLPRSNSKGFFNLSDDDSSDKPLFRESRTNEQAALLFPTHG
ncbi:hypothetical protein SB775_32925, partial [Peribacillus sp. SIMBA_075]|uniref:hypothetical protein n=1 Tax=Peribacillus sp. SIMBA_075 TaxID=3085813 RepID=UPI00397CAAF0